jgi:molybdopterin-guanine dinucleotide biosynthesis protein A
VVLAGGKSSRFGSDKALALLRGRPLLDHAVAGLAGFEQVLVAWKPGDRARDEAYCRIIGGRAAAVGDASAAETPLAGLFAGLLASRHELVFACAADMPFAADGALLEALFAAVQSSNAAVPESEGAPQPLCAVWRRDPALAAARDLLSLTTPRGPRALAERLGAARLKWADPRPFVDVDSKEALRSLS